MLSQHIIKVTQLPNCKLAEMACCSVTLVGFVITSAICIAAGSGLIAVVCKQVNSKSCGWIFTKFWYR